MTAMDMLKLATEFGLPGVLLVLWWMDGKRRDTTLEKYRQDFTDMMQHVTEQNQANHEQYRTDMEEMRGMYRTNAALVKRFADVAGDLRELVVLNTRSMTQVQSAIENNRFCPVMREGKSI